MKMKEEREMSSLLPGFGSRKAGALLLDRRSMDATPSEGDFSFTSKGNYWYVAPGSINSGNGWYSIGMYPNGTIFHRSFSTYYPFAH
jgi:hypothetical protein